MLVFIIPVKHPARSQSYDRVCALLRNTLGSVQAQLHPDFATVVVLNERPAWAVDSERLKFVEVDFPPAEPPRSKQDWVNWLYLDRGAKIAVGLAHAKSLAPTHVMPVDADDFVSNRLAGFVSEHPDSPGWFMPLGITWSGLFRIGQRRDRFWSYCGTSHIFRYDLMSVPDELIHCQSRDEIIDRLGMDYVERVLGNHIHYNEHFGRQGITLAPLPFIGGIWHADTGENSSRAWWRQTRFGPIWGTELTAAEEAEFRIPAGKRTHLQSLLLFGWRVRSRLATMAKSLMRVPPAARRTNSD